MQKYSDQFISWLFEAGYTHCFFVAGGNVMHLVEAASKKFTCVPFIHEVGCTIAAEYFNESSSDSSRAFVLVTAGPGLTNTITGVASAWVEGRELLIIGGQAKSGELSGTKYRQIGFQEFDGISLCKSITKESFLINKKINKSKVFELIRLSRAHRKGPVFIEFCIDISILPEDERLNDVNEFSDTGDIEISFTEISKVISLLTESKRPIILIGGETPRNYSLQEFKELNIPLATTFNGADRVGIEYKYYAGRPNWYGSRWSNLILQQSDLIIAVGARLGLMQVGYNWKKFAPKAKVIQVYSDKVEMDKDFPQVDLKILGSSDLFLDQLKSELTSINSNRFDEWGNFIIELRNSLAIPESINVSRSGFVEPLKFVYDLVNKHTNGADLIVPCSSGEASYVGPMRVMLNKEGQKIVTNNAMASMGYGLSGAIGASIANPEKRVILFEGDGGFAQNIQELSTVKTNNLNIKIFLMNNGGYMSIKQNQKNAFNGHYIGCDVESGLGMPNWELVAKSFGVKYFNLNEESIKSSEFENHLNSEGPIFFDLQIDPEQTYFPKIVSVQNKDGSIVSNPIHVMEPALSNDLEQSFIKYI
jgi:acetolactate synthase-1/2/3 large subunit